jgi:hypothetical protein
VLSKRLALVTPAHIYTFVINELFLMFSANEVFHCVHFECPAQRDSMTALTAATANNDNIVSGSAQTASSQTSPMVDNDNVAVK